MSTSSRKGTRERLLSAAADLIASSPGDDFSLRAVCNAAGVQVPTLYHFFGSKDGLIEAVIQHGFDLYLGKKESMEHSGDPMEDIRSGWDAHVAFGLENPGFYTLMYGKIRPGYSPPAQARPSQILLSLTTHAAEQRRLAVSPEQAAAHILVTNIGVTLRQIVLGSSDRELSIAVREGAIAAITGVDTGEATDNIGAAVEAAAARREVLGNTETKLLVEWLQRLKEDIEAEKLWDESANRDE